MSYSKCLMGVFAGKSSDLGAQLRTAPEVTARTSEPLV